MFSFEDFIVSYSYASLDKSFAKGHLHHIDCVETSCCEEREKLSNEETYLIFEDCFVNHLVVIIELLLVHIWGLDCIKKERCFEGKTKKTCQNKRSCLLDKTGTCQKKVSMLIKVMSNLKCTSKSHHWKEHPISLTKKGNKR